MRFKNLGSIDTEFFFGFILQSVELKNSLINRFMEVIDFLIRIGNNFFSCVDGIIDDS